MKLQFKRLSYTSFAPTKAHADDAGFDLRADLGIGEILTIYPGMRMLVPTNIAFAPPEHTYIRIAPRSGLANKYGIDVFAGVIDRGYREGVGVILFNSGKSAFEVQHGDKIAQAIVELIAPIDELFDVGIGDLPDSERGTNGFGSSGR